MEKIALIGDTHFNRKAENPTIKKLIKSGQADFFDNLVIDLNDRGVKTILLTGDIFDTRNTINVESLVTAKRLFETKLSEFDVHIILGNHDMYYENSYDITSIEMIEHLPNVTVYRDGVKAIKLLGHNWLMFPWIIPENVEKTVKFLESESKKSRSQQKILFGHFETMGIDMEGGNISTFGMKSDTFLGASPLSISGHYHGKSITTGTDSRLVYLGSPYAMTFANSDQSHGYWLLDENLEFEFIENHVSPKFTTIRDTDDLDDLPDLSNKFVRFYMNNSKDRDQLFELRAKVESKNPLFLRPIPYKDGTVITEATATSNEHEANNLLGMDTMSLSSVYIDANHEHLPTLQTTDDSRKSVMEKLFEYKETLNIKQG